MRVVDVPHPAFSRSLWFRAAGPQTLMKLERISIFPSLDRNFAGSGVDIYSFSYIALAIRASHPVYTLGRILFAIHEYK